MHFWDGAIYTRGATYIPEYTVHFFVWVYIHNILKNESKNCTMQTNIRSKKLRSLVQINRNKVLHSVFGKNTIF